MSLELWPALISALIGGAVGSGITAWTSLAITRSRRREGAANALWVYHYSLASLAAEVGSNLGDIEAITLLKSDWDEMRANLKAAYPFAGYLSSRARRELFTSAWIDVDTRPEAEWYEQVQLEYNGLTRLASRLENELDWAFPRRSGDRLRSLARQGKTRVAEHRLAAYRRKRKKAKV